ncbi:MULTISPECIES: PEPxxWA-CTERM sorting domain-containing protein [unclassified Sphingomonas]|uniref:PEPxxWA-CTERM sorting domain-containing protein n=1 Tax=unclassified Sphingomonas TaxID=196159 RepID=UPI0025EA7B58|nr:MULTISPECIES: PEPxxWA-CTERM sorting domain-containing protein [unclassified Sphingomonas]
MRFGWLTAAAAVGVLTAPSAEAGARFTGSFESIAGQSITIDPMIIPGISGNMLVYNQHVILNLSEPGDINLLASGGYNWIYYNRDGSPDDWGYMGDTMGANGFGTTLSFDIINAHEELYYHQWNASYADQLMPSDQLYRVVDYKMAIRYLSFLSDVYTGTVYYSIDISGIPGSWAAVPEPETWAMLILGFGVVGFAMRRQAGAKRGEATNVLPV